MAIVYRTLLIFLPCCSPHVAAAMPSPIPPIRRRSLSVGSIRPRAVSIRADVYALMAQVLM